VVAVARSACVRAVLTAAAAMASKAKGKAGQRGAKYFATTKKASERARAQARAREDADLRCV
jgi:hypothetical protein